VTRLIFFVALLAGAYFLGYTAGRRRGELRPGPAVWPDEIREPPRQVTVETISADDEREIR
jgi:hypothetical protein